MTAMEENYEKLRVLLSPKGFATLPRHELTDQLLKNIYSEEEAALVAACFKEFNKTVSLNQIEGITGIPEGRLKEQLEDMEKKGKIRSRGETDYFMLAYLPGVFEDYFTIYADDPEKMKGAAIAHRALQKIGFSPDVKFPLKQKFDFNEKSGWRFMPAAEPLSKTIEINESLETEHHVLPFEILEKYLAEYDVFAVTRCSCRTMAELAGEPCKRTSENFCVQAGPSAEAMIATGVGKQLNFDEMMEVMRNAAKDGLVHSTQNMQDPASFICNCCSCCCASLYSIKELKLKGGAARTNFTPVIDPDDCTLCETCAGMCPMEVISLEEVDGDDLMIINHEFCIGCGVCAVNCPEEAITLQKTGNAIPVKTRPDLFGEVD